MTDGLDAAPALAPDPGLPAARGLFGAPGRDAVASFLRRRGWEAAESRPVQAMYRPGGSCVVRHRVRATTRAGDARVLSICVETRARARTPLPVPETFVERYGLAAPLDDVGPYQVWAFPYDPSLEGLPDAAWGPAVRELLRSTGEGLSAVSVEPLRYRPRHRAVFRYVTLSRGRRGNRRGVTFGKVLRQEKAARWAAGEVSGRRRLRRHPLRLALPVAAESGTLMVPALAGASLRDLLLAGGSLPSPDRVARVLDDLPAAARGIAVEPDGVRERLVNTAQSAARLVARLTPEAAPGAARVADAVAQGAAETAVAPRLVHGDLYEAQIFVGEGFSMGLIDLDDLGPGDPAMDAANACAHLLALALSVPAAAERLVAYRALLRGAFATRLGVDPSELAWREALAMLLLASGPFRVLHRAWPAEVGRRVDLAIRLQESRR